MAWLARLLPLLLAGPARGFRPARLRRHQGPQSMAASTEGEAATKLVFVVAAAIFDGDEVLLATRLVGEKQFWEFPGGKVESGETPEGALRREIQEELGLDLGTLTPLTFASKSLGLGKHLLMPLFACSEWTGVPTLREGQSAFKFVSAESLEALEDGDVMPADVPMIPAVAQALRRMTPKQR
ncbi:NUDIX hydrolase domain-like protein [Pelagophyceae sp. CCMP2097]|nr:NUDIX hydrolase domain-like protein [Pelagophyceae sp. CCMP2097]|mmetsp:Transcript_30288/g.102160  ORF Transcript_30288/g.102160 Transcript_30288/m.102160 type:complete len:183 (-) Transcript_30288:6-554(-)